MHRHKVIITRLLNRGMVIFGPGAIRRVYRESGGTPRVVNLICDRALLAGFTQEKRRIDARTGPLVALMVACKLTRRVYEKDRRREADRRAKALVRSEAFARIVGETMLEIQTGVAKAVAASGQS